MRPPIRTKGRSLTPDVLLSKTGRTAPCLTFSKIHLTGERWCTPGHHISYFELEGVPSTVMICHDEQFYVWTNTRTVRKNRLTQTAER
jgi:hypothetical protein